MNVLELTETSQPDLVRGQSCVVVVAADDQQDLRDCLASVVTHTATEVPIVIVSDQPVAELGRLLGALDELERTIWLARAHVDQGGDLGGAATTTAAVGRVLHQLRPADVALLSDPCVVTAGWLEALSRAALADSNTASASALVDEGTALALSDRSHPSEDISALAQHVAENTMKLRPRLNVIVGPCTYMRRDTLELVGALDVELPSPWALEVDFAQRCLLSGLVPVAADDVVVKRLGPAPTIKAKLPAAIVERYPYLDPMPETPGSAVLPRALEAARRPRQLLSVTVDARALGSILTGTQRHILELIRALTTTGAVRLRLLVSDDTSAENIEVLRSFPQTELLAVRSIDAATPLSTIFHRPQQVFGVQDMRLALRLGERMVLNQLDLIAYRNPGYHADATAWHSYRRVSRQALAAADRVVVFSGHTRKELLSDELVDAERVRIVPPGLDHPATGPDRRPAGLDAASALDPDLFLLCLGTDFRHKNRLFALRMLASLRERHGWQGLLVLAGTHIPYGSSLELERAFLGRHPELHDVVIDLGAVDEEEKSWLMRHAAAVTYPSVYEGFGLVPFEAALSGVPCLFASQSSLAEVLPADMAAIVPWDPELSADKAHELVVNPVARAEHLETIIDSARRLTWAAAAETTVEVYREAAVAATREATALSRDELEREDELHELLEAHDALVARLVADRDKVHGMYEHARRNYDELNAEVGFGLSLIGPNGTLPDDVQRALLALSARPRFSRAVYGPASKLFRAGRAIARGVGKGSDPSR